MGSHLKPTMLNSRGLSNFGLHGAILIFALLYTFVITKAQQPQLLGKKYDPIACKDKKCVPRCCPDGQTLVKSNLTTNHGFACGSSGSSGSGESDQHFYSGFPQCGGMPDQTWNYSLIQRPADEAMTKDTQGKLSLKTDSGDTVMADYFCLSGLGALTCPKMGLTDPEAEGR